MDDPHPRQRIKQEIDAAAGRHGSLSRLTQALWHRKGEVRAAAAWSLGEIAEPASLPDLLAATQDPEWLVRRNAIAALAKIGHSGAEPRLIACLSDPAPQVRAEAANALAELGTSSALPALQALLDDDQPARLQKFAGQTVGEVVGGALARLAGS